MSITPRIEDVRVSAFTIPTETPEQDGTFDWKSTTLVLAEAVAGDATGLGYSYASRAAGMVIGDLLREITIGRSAMNVRGMWEAMNDAARNIGRPGVAAMAISAVDCALWDLKARVLGVPLVSLLGAVRDALPVYGSGGFTNYSLDKLREQLAGWVRDGISRVKMKVGRAMKADRERVAAAREAIGADAELFVDANGAYSRKEALAQAEAFAECGVTWFEEPVSSDDWEGLRLLRDRAPAGMHIAAGEYGFDPDYFRKMVAAGAVDILQADATRCCGLTGFLEVSALCDAHHLPLSSHCAPALHAHVGCAVGRMVHAEYFFDHARVENMLFDGTLQPRNGALTPDLSRTGNGLAFKHADAERFHVNL
jgi:L-alanine-DL-glutamate epimerase-like enolase superfamily enzyme